MIVPVAPGIFYLPDSGNWAIAINADGSLAAPANAVPGVATHPAGAGDARDYSRHRPWRCGLTDRQRGGIA